MIRLKTVLVATDFSKTSEVALQYGRELARTFGAELRVLHVADNILTRYAFAGPALVAYDAQAEYEKSVNTQLNDLVDADDRRELRASAVIRVSNSPADSIVDYARELGVDVIVMGTHGRRALARALLGSVAERVVRLAPCPVLTVRTPEHEFIAPDALVSVAKV